MITAVKEFCAGERHHIACDQTAMIILTFAQIRITQGGQRAL